MGTFLGVMFIVFVFFPLRVVFEVAKNQGGSLTRKGRRRRRRRW